MPASNTKHPKRFAHLRRGFGGQAKRLNVFFVVFLRLAIPNSLLQCFAKH